MWNIVVEPERPQMTLWLVRIACWIIQATYPLRECNTYCFSTAKMVEKPGGNITLKVHFLSCLLLLRYSPVSIIPTMCQIYSLTDDMLFLTTDRHTQQ